MSRRHWSVRAASFALLAGLALTAIPAPVVQAGSGSTACQVRNVTQDTSDSSLATMVAAASDGDRLRVSGTCVGGVVIDTDLTITGVGPAPILSGGGRDRVLEVRAEATVTLEHLVISHGAAPYGGGILNAGTLTLAYARVRGNRAGPSDRCGLWPDPTCVYRRDSSNFGGGIVKEGTLTIVATRVRRNRAGVGGGIVNRGRMTIRRSTVARNVAALWSESWGGGIVNAGTLTIRRSTVARNTVISGEYYAEGGGILNGGRLSVSDSTVSHNRARGNNGGTGGGIANGSEYGGGGRGEVLLETTTVTGNQVSGFVNRAGGIFTCHVLVCGGSGTFTVRASIIAGNGRDCAGHFRSDGHNLIGVAGGRCRGFEQGVERDRVGTPADPIDPLLGPLVHNGGSTSTHALRADSPAIDHAGPGPCVTRQDQRGVRRPQGDRCDIGAFERR